MSKFGENHLPTGFQYILPDKTSGQYGFLITTTDQRHFYLRIKSSYQEKKKLESAIVTLIRYFKINPEKELISSFQNLVNKPSTRKTSQFIETVERVKKELSGASNWWFAETERSSAS